jgi:hypothetical protein
VVKLVQKAKKNRLRIGQDQDPVDMGTVHVRVMSTLKERLAERLWSLVIAVVAGSIAGLIVTFL